LWRGGPPPPPRGGGVGDYTGVGCLPNKKTFLVWGGLVWWLKPEIVCLANTLTQTPPKPPPYFLGFLVFPFPRLVCCFFPPRYLKPLFLIGGHQFFPVLSPPNYPIPPFLVTPGWGFFPQLAPLTHHHPPVQTFRLGGAPPEPNQSVGVCGGGGGGGFGGGFLCWGARAGVCVFFVFDFVCQKN